jgi:micrococcal nuclease
MLMHEYKCKIVKVVDGDTVDVDIDLGFSVILKKQRIRLKGIDTPESRTRDLEEKKFGIFAKHYVLYFLPLNKYATIRTYKDSRGKFGRILGDFVIYDHREDRENTLVEMMLRDSIGVKYEGQNKKEIAEKHLENRKIIAATDYLQQYTITGRPDSHYINN